MSVTIQLAPLGLAPQDVLVFLQDQIAKVFGAFIVTGRRYS